MKLSELKESFITYCKVKGIKARLTVDRYDAGLQEFISIVGDIDVGKLSIFHVDQYQIELINRGCSQKTIFTKLCFLRSWVKWMHLREIKVNLLREQIELPKLQRILKDVPSRDDFHKLIQAMSDPKTIIRDRAILALLATSGLRVSELVSLNRDDLNFETNTASIVGKGSKQRLVYFPETTADLLRKYLATRKDDLPYLFTPCDEHYSHMRLTARSVQRTLKTLSKRIGVRVTPHALRHFFATYLLENNTDIFSISKMLGHSSVATTQIYLHKSNKQLQEQHNRVFNNFV